MKNKKLSLLLRKLPEDRKEAFAAEMKRAGMGAYEAVVAKYGIVLTDDEKAFLASNSMEAVGDAELGNTAGGYPIKCNAPEC